MELEKYSNHLINAILIYSIFIAALCISFDTVNTLKYGAIDLRNRVVGTRVLLDGKDPYFFKWDDNTPEYFVDARDIYSNFPMSRLTVPPSVLLLHSPFASIPYKTQQILWAFIQWILLLVSILLLADIARSKIQKKIIWIVGLLFIAGSFFWRMHVSIGQNYILYTFLIILSFWLAKQKFKTHYFLSGFILGITTAFRFPVLLFAIPFLIQKKWRIITGGITGIIIVFSSTFFVANIGIWKSYFASLKFHEQFHLSILEPIYGLHPNSVIDGIKNAVFSANLPRADSSFQDIFRRYLNIKVHSQTLEISLIIILIVIIFFLYKNRSEKKSMEYLFFVGVALIFISEYFLPAARLSYNNVIWLPLLSFIIIRTSNIF